MRNIVIYKLVILNFMAFAWLAGTESQTQWFSKLFLSDTTRINYMTSGMFLFTLVATLVNAIRINKAWNNINGDYAYEGAWRGISWLTDIEWIEKAAGWMLFLGLIGTLYGLMLSLSGVNTGNFSNVEGIKQIAVQMVTGLRIELSTTLIGAILSLWTEVNYTVVSQTTQRLADMEEEALLDNDQV